MKFPNRIFFALLSINIACFGQSRPAPKSNPSLPGYSGFHSNLGLQEIIEVGVPLSVSTDVTSSATEASGSILQRLDAANAKPPPPPKPKGPLVFSTQAGMRAYTTSNVLRQESSLAKSSGVVESNLGIAVSHRAFKINEYVTMLPRLDMMMQWAWYAQNSELLDYQFGLVKAGIAFGFPNDWSVGTSLDYNTLSNLESGDKTFDSISPSVSLQKIIPVSESSFILFDSMVRLSNMRAETFFPAAGVFADSGDNYQTSFSVSYLKMLGFDQEWTIMPRLAINRTNYTKTPNTGRLDYLLSAGVSAIYQWTDWLGLQSFITYNKMDSDTISNFNAFDLGIAINGNFSF